MLTRLFGIYPDFRKAQESVLKMLVEGGGDTAFGRRYGLGKVRDIDDFRKSVPLNEYDSLEPYILKLLNGEHYQLWGQKCRFFAKSSGTSSSKSKFIPVTRDNLSSCHLRGFKMMLASYIDNNPSSRLFMGKSLTIAGTLEKSVGGIFTGDLSGILTYNAPKLAGLFKIPSRDIALIGDFDTKIREISRRYSHSRVTSIAGVPAWNLLMIEKLLEYNNAEVLTDLWPDIELFMHGGTDFSAYRDIFRRLIPSDKMHYLENYNASEGYFAFQDDLSDPGMLLTLNNAVLYEFIPMDRLDEALADASRIRVGESSEGKYVDFDNLETVRTGVDYAIVISTNAGLWRYLIGDCVRFTSLNPHKIVITGRTKLFINAFGEELMIGNAEKAMSRACSRFGVNVREYTVAPVFMSDEGSRNVSGAHEWVVEFMSDEPDIEAFADCLDEELQAQNSDYEAKRTHTHTMERLHITVVPKGTFNSWMESRGKLGGQNKVPRLCNDRHIVESVLEVAGRI